MRKSTPVHRRQPPVDLLAWYDTWRERERFEEDDFLDEFRPDGWPPAEQERHK